MKKQTNSISKKEILGMMFGNVNVFLNSWNSNLRMTL